MFASTQALLVLFLLCTLGWFLRRRGVLTPAALPALSLIALDVALPALVFVTMLDQFRGADARGWYFFPAAWAGFMVISFALSWAFAPLARPPVRREFRFCLFYHNAIFFPLAVLSEMFGAGARPVAELFLMTFLFPAFFFNTYSAFLRAEWRVDWRRTAHPVLFTTLAAVALAVTDSHAAIPRVILNAARQLGAVSVPLLMLLVGARLREDFEHRGPVYWREIARFVLLKNLLIPLFFFILLPRLPLWPSLRFLLLLQAAMPPVTAAPIVIEREGGQASFAGQLLVSSYVVSVATIPLFIWAHSAFWTPCG